MTSRSARQASRRPAVIAAAALLGASALLGACSSSSKSTSAGSTTTTPAPDPTSPPPTGTPLEIALMVDASGPNSSGQGDVVPVAQAWVAYTNNHGGVAKHPVTLTVKDTKGDPPTGQSQATALVGDRSVIGTLIVDAAGESTFAKTLSDGELPVIGGVGYYPSVWGALPNVFGVATTFPAVVDMQPLSAQAVGAKAAGVAACAEVDSCAAAAPIFEAKAKKLGMAYTGLVKVGVNASSFSAECLQFINKKTDFIQLSGGAAVGGRLYADCVQQGFSGYLGASAGTVLPALYNSDPSLKLAGATNGFPWWVDAAPVAQFRKVMGAGKVSEDKWGSPNATAVYASLELFKKTLGADTGLPASVARTDVVAAYGQVKNETLGGLLPQPLTFTAGKPMSLINCFWQFKYQNKKFSGSFTPACDKPSRARHAF